MPRDSHDSPYSEPSPARPRRRGRSRKSAKKSAPPAAEQKSHARPHAIAATPHAPSKKRGRSRKKGGGPPRPELTSHPTSRNAQVDTRAWLLRQYGPSCAYCGTKVSPRVITLDHVAPRRGQTAYDRRDNLVLACRACNALKRDQAPLAFLLAVKTRAANLLRYGAHLSAGLLAMARPLVKDTGASMREMWGPDDDDDISPYRD
jgi:5-methylcytosine-specific restriction endonuclease McrA